MKIQWLGHAAFKLVGQDATVLIDPFLSGNPKFEGDIDEVTADVTHVLLTHGHNDHFGDTIEICQKTGATLIAMIELTDYVEMNHEGISVVPTNMGGTIRQDGFSVTSVQAFHSSSYNTPDGQAIYGGMPTGLIVDMDGQKVYHMGDTTIFSDMGLINELYRPDIGIVPIGDHFTMGPDIAALAVNRYFDFKTVIPCHYMTFDLLAQSASGFAGKVEKGRVEIMDPMGTLEV